MPGSRASASAPATSRSTYWASSSRLVGSVLTSASQGRGRRDVEAGVGEGRAQLAARVVQCLVERAARRAESLGEHVDGDAVERQGGEDLALMRRERSADRAGDG